MLSLHHRRLGRGQVQPALILNRRATHGQTSRRLDSTCAARSSTIMFRVFRLTLFVSILLLTTLSLVTARPTKAAPRGADVWTGVYFANTTLTKPPVFVRDDPEINFDWGTGSPNPSVPADNFSVRWKRYY